MFAKIEVKGENAAPLYKMLISKRSGLEDTGDVKWNFEKFLIGKDGKVIKRYRSKVKPADIAGDIEKALAAG
jgi:glutathione peroxidase